MVFEEMVLKLLLSIMAGGMGGILGAYVYWSLQK